MADETPAERWKRWITPKEAIARCVAVQPPFAVVAIMERLRLGSVASMAAELHWKGKKEEHAAIPIRVWQGLPNASTNPFWQTGQLSSWVGDRYEQHPVNCLGIRFDPDGISAMDIAAVPVAPLPAAASAPESSTQKGPPVSDAALKAWFELYKRFHEGPGPDEEHALKSAKGMFHDKTVSRDRVRDLRGPQQRGRPTRKP